MADVDAGKTTLTERILFMTGTVRKMGSVDDGTTRTDTLEVERERGISVRSAVTSVVYKSVDINITDTPGHADFISQVMRAFTAVDSAVILVSALDGIRAGTEILLDTLKKSGIPAVIFINKCDVSFTEPQKITESIIKNYPEAFDVEKTDEMLAENDEECMKCFFEKGIPDELRAKTLRSLVSEGKAYPIICGSAVTGDGVQMLLDVITDLFSPPCNGKDGLCGTVFALGNDRTLGRGAYTRLFSGSLRVRDSIVLNGSEYKITQIRTPLNGKFTDTGTLYAGQIGIVYGLSEVKTGDIIGDITLAGRDISVKAPLQALLTVGVTATDGTDVIKLKSVLEQLTAEEPLLSLTWEPISKTLCINVFGTVMTEVLHDIIKDRYGIETEFGKPAVIYKETPSKHGYGFNAYTMPKPSWAILRFEITPLERGSGVVYSCTAPPDRLSYRYRKQVSESIKASIAQGPLGWEVTDMELNLIDGEDHPIHTHPLDFTIATPLALADGFRNTSTTLLEPMLKVRFTLDSVHYGRLYSDIIRMRGECEPPKHRDNIITVDALIPVATSLEYASELASYSSGKGRMTAVFGGYRECPKELGKTAERRGVDPLDRSKYILAARHALSGTVFE